MRYMGSKARHAKHIVPILMAGHDASKPYIEPFLGGGNIMSSIDTPIRWGGDIEPYTVALLSAVADGWVPPTTVSESEYISIRNNPEDYHPALVGFAAYSCSFGGKFFGGFWRAVNSKGQPRNCAEEQVRYLNKQAKGLQNVNFYVSGYDEINYPDESTVYMDPPYVGTTKYGNKSFDSEAFWKFCESLSLRCHVFVSEYKAPPNWVAVWEKKVTSSLDLNTGGKSASEKLFIMATLGED